MYCKVAGLIVGLAAVGLCGCGDIPTSGPTKEELIDRALKEQNNFDYVEVNSRVVSVLRMQAPETLKKRFESSGEPPSPVIGIGDTVSVTLWQSSGGGIGSALPETTSGVPAIEAEGTTRSGPIPAQVVGGDGDISVPYAGRIHAVGLTPYEIQLAIQKRLASREIEPQAIVTVTKSVSNAVTVIGDTVTGGRVALSMRGDRLLDVCAEAGGMRSPIYGTVLRLTRGGVTATVPMETLVANPDEDIYAWPGDIITLVHVPQTFAIFGASGLKITSPNNNEIAFDAARMDLAQALAKSGGLEDSRADPSAVFLFRFEKVSVAKELGAHELSNATDGTTPVLYHLDFRDPAGYFLAKRFPMDEGDIVYIADAKLTEWQKFLNLVATIAIPVETGILFAAPSGHL